MPIEINLFTSSCSTQARLVRGQKTQPLAKKDDALLGFNELILRDMIETVPLKMNFTKVLAPITDLVPRSATQFSLEFLFIRV